MGSKTPRAGRTSFLNASKSAAIAETIRKEERAVLQLFQKQVALGHLRLPSEDEDEAAERGQACEHAEAAARAEIDNERIARLLGKSAEAEEDPEALRKDRLQDISRSVWSAVNPGYLNPEGRFQSASQAAFAWKEAEVERMREQGELSSKHHRKRDGFTIFAEAAARNTHLQRRGGEAH